MPPPPVPPLPSSASAPAGPVNDAASRALAQIAQTLQQIGTIGQSDGFRRLGRDFISLAQGLNTIHRSFAIAGGGAAQVVSRFRVMEQATARIGQAALKAAGAQRAAVRGSERSADARNVRAAAARVEGRSDRDIGADISRRARETKEMLRKAEREERVRTGALKKSVAYDARDEPSPGGPGDRDDIIAASRAEIRHRSRMRIEENYQQALDDSGREKMLRDRSNQGSALFYDEQHSGYERMAQAGYRQASEAEAQRRMESGGAGYSDGTYAVAGKENIEELRARQEDAYAGNVRGGKQTDLRDAQRLVAYEKERQDYLASPEGRAALEEELRLKAALAESTAKTARIERDAASAWDATAEGQSAKRDAMLRGREEDLRLLRESVELERKRQEYLGTYDGGRSRAEEVRLKAEKEALARHDALEDARRRQAHADTPEGKEQLAAKVSGDQSGKVDALREATRLEKERAKHLASPEGKKSLAEQVKLRREIEKAKRSSGRLEGTAEKGAFFAGMDAAADRLGKVEKSLKGIADIGQTAFAGVTTGVVGLAALGDPSVTFATLEGSLRLLGVEMSAAFLPLVNELSAKLQSAAGWVRGLSEGTKTWAARLAVWVAAGGATIAVMYKMVVAARALTLAVGGLNAALGVGLVMLAVGAVSALAGEYVLLGEKASVAAQAVGEVGKAAGLGGKKSENAITAQDIEKLPDGVREKALKASGDRGKLAEVLREWQAEVAKQLDAQKAKQLPGLDVARKRDEQINKAMGQDVEMSAAHYRTRRRWNAESDKDYKEQFDANTGTLGEVVGPLSRALSRTLDFVGPSTSRQMQNTVRDAKLLEESDRDVARLGKGAIERLKKQGVTVFDDTKMKPDERRERMEKGEVPTSDVYARIMAALRGMERTGSVEADRASRTKNDELLKLESRKKLAEDLLARSGAGKGEFVGAFKSPVRPEFLDPAQYGERLQLAALGDPLEAQILKRQVELAEQQLRVQEQIRDRQNPAPPPVAPRER